MAAPAPLIVDELVGQDRLALELAEPAVVAEDLVEGEGGVSFGGDDDLGSVGA